MNELEKRAKKHRRKQKGLSPFNSLSPDNICMLPDRGSDTAINTFNKGTGLTMSEDMKFNIGDRVEFFAPGFGQTWGNIRQIIDDNGTPTAVIKAANKRIYNVKVSDLEDEMDFGLFETYLKESDDAGERSAILNRIREYNPYFKGLQKNGEPMGVVQLMAIEQRYKEDASKEPPLTPEEAKPKEKVGGIVNPDKSFNGPDDFGEEDCLEIAQSMADKLKKIDEKCFQNSDSYLGLCELYEGVEDKLDANERNELRKLVNTTNDPETIANYLAAVTSKKESLHEDDEDVNCEGCEDDDDSWFLDEDYMNRHDDWGDPYDVAKIERVIKQLTKDFKVVEGILRTYYEQEKQAAVEVLKKHYNVVEVSDGRFDNNDDISYVISYAEPKVDESLNEAKYKGKYEFDPDNMSGDYSYYRITLDDNDIGRVDVWDRENKEDDLAEAFKTAYNALENTDGTHLEIVYVEGDDYDEVEDTVFEVDLSDEDDYEFFLDEVKSYNKDMTQEEILHEAYEPEIRDGYYRMDIKHVKDSDGFLTDYTWWYNPETERHVFVFGDSDMYGPADSDIDWEADSEETAKEWWDDYTGPYEDEDFDESLTESYSDKDVKDFLNEVGGYTDYDGKVEELMDYFGMTKDQAESAIQDYVTFSDDEGDLDEGYYVDLNNDIVFIADACEFDHDTMEPTDTIADVEVTMPELIKLYGENVVEIAMIGVTRQAVQNAGGIPSKWDIGHLINNIASQKFHEANQGKGFVMGDKIEVERTNLLPDAVELMQRKVGDMLLPKDEGLEEAVSDLSHPEQEFDSAATSINSSKLPAIYKMVKFNPGDVVIDFGGGRFDNAVEYIKDKGSTLVVYDPYNRSAEHNEQVLATLEENGGADAAVNSNVLNVIKEPEARKAVLENIKKLLKPGAPVYITVYEGRGDGVEGPTKSGYQLNRKTEGYLEEVQEVFPDAKRKGKLIIATNS